MVTVFPLPIRHGQSIPSLRKKTGRNSQKNCGLFVVRMSYFQVQSALSRSVHLQTVRIAPRQQHFMAAAKAAQPKVHAGSENQPTLLAAGMRFLHDKDISKTNIHIVSSFSGIIFQKRGNTLTGSEAVMKFLICQAQAPAVRILW